MITCREALEVCYHIYRVRREGANACFTIERFCEPKGLEIYIYGLNVYERKRIPMELLRRLEREVDATISIADRRSLWDLEVALVAWKELERAVRRAREGGEGAPEPA